MSEFHTLHVTRRELFAYALTMLLTGFGLGLMAMHITP